MTQAEIDMRVLAVSLLGLLPGTYPVNYGWRVALAIRCYMLQLVRST